MSLLSAFRHGLRRAADAPRLLLLLWVVNALAALPMAVVVGASIHGSVGESLVSENLVEGFDSGWFGEYEAAARGLETSFRPSILGAAAFFDNLEAWWTGRLFSGFPGLVGAGVLYALLWAFLLGGVLQWLARPQGFEGKLFTGSLFEHSGRFFLRFVRLAVASGVLYWLIYRLARWLFRTVQDLARDVTAERTVFLWVLLGAGLIVLLLTVVRLVFDYAKVLAVLENRHGMLLAAWAGLRFVLAHPVRTLGLYGGMVLLWVGVLAIYALAAPGPGQSTWVGVGLAFLAGQVMVVARLFLRVSLLSGELELYRALGAVQGQGSPAPQLAASAATAG